MVNNVVANWDYDYLLTENTKPLIKKIYDCETMMLAVPYSILFFNKYKSRYSNYTPQVEPRFVQFKLSFSRPHPSSKYFTPIKNLLKLHSGAKH